MLYYSVNISRAHWYKESFLKALNYKEPDKARAALIEWMQNAEHCSLVPFENKWTKNKLYYLMTTRPGENAVEE